AQPPAATSDRLRSSKRNRPHQQMLGVDPRRTATCAIADVHLPIAPGTDVAFLNAVGRLVVQNGRADEHFIGFHTRGFVDYVAFLMSQPLDELVETCGVPRADVERAAKLIGKGKAFLSFYCMGVNQSTLGMWKN